MNIKSLAIDKPFKLDGLWHKVRIMVSLEPLGNPEIYIDGVLTDQEHPATISIDMLEPK